MQLTLYTDYSLRVLIYLGLYPDKLATISEIARRYGISRNHLVKVVHNLSQNGYVKTTRGKGGGLALARAPEQINVGDVVRHTELNFDIVECFEQASSTCPIAPACALRRVLHEATAAFMEVLNGYTVADVLRNRHQLAALLPDPARTSAGRDSGGRQRRGS
jgi:Rrf2 family nitric oxide-sensitive transcriptional repressor